MTRRNRSIFHTKKFVAMVLLICCAHVGSSNSLVFSSPPLQGTSLERQTGQEPVVTDKEKAASTGPDENETPVKETNAPPDDKAIATSPQKQKTVRLRFYWGGGTPLLWNGTVRLKQGSFSHPQVLGVTSDAAASVLAVNDQLQIEHWSTTSFGGIDIDVPDSVGNQIELVLGDGPQTEPLVQETVSLADLLHGSFYKELDTTGNRILIARAPGDLLPVQISRPHLIFEPQEAFEFSVGVNRSDWASQKANCRIRMQRLNSSNSNHPLAAIGPPKLNSISSNHTNAQAFSFDIDAAGSAAAKPVRLTMPSEEGVYQIAIELVAPWQQASFKPRTTVRRQIQVVVLHSRPPAADPAQAWNQIESIDPTIETSAVSNSLLALGLKPNSTSLPLGNDQRRTVTVDGKPMLELDVGGWLAVPVTFQQIDRPHLIEIEYLADQPASLGFSLLDPDSGGQIPVNGFDSGLHIPSSLIDVYPKSASRHRQRHQFVVWPQNKSSHLLIANRDSQQPATIGKIEVFTGPTRLYSGAVSHSTSADTSRIDSAVELSPAGSRASKNRRHFMVFSEQGLFAKNFGGPEAVDASGNRYADWETFLRGADRLIQHLKTNEYSGAFLTVAVDGSTLYPSAILGNSPRIDTGLLSSAGVDPLRKDVLELLFRMFEREGLTLIPAMVFNGPLPAIEAARIQSAESSLATRPVHLNGSKTELRIEDDFPLYNPLNPAIQSQVNAAIVELSSRYRRFECFGGIAIVCRPDTYAILPGQQWCCDVETFNQFWSANQGDETLLNNREQLVQEIFGPQQDRWQQWRAGKMATWYQTLAQSLHEQRPDAKLFLAPVDLYLNEELAAVLSPNLHSTADFAQQMLRIGWDAEQLAQLKHVLLLKPRRLAPNQSLADNRIEVSLENQLQSDAFFNQARAIGDLYVNRVSWAHFSQLEDTAAFEAQRGAIMRLQPLTPAGIWNRQRFLHSIRASDSQFLVDGGSLVSMGQEAELMEFRKLFHQLPAQPFVDVNPIDMIKLNPTDSPVVVRQHLSNEGLWFYAVNPSPWPCKVQLKLSAASQQPLRIRPLSNGALKQISNENGAVIELEMEPISLTGGVIEQVNSIENFRFELPTQAADPLRKQVHMLQAKLLKSTNSQPLDVLNNSYFEVHGQPSLSGWEMGQQGTQGISLITENPLKGHACLRLKNDDQSPVWIRSNSFPLPRTGRLSISVWLRTPDPNQQPPLRISVEGIGSESNYYRFGSIAGLSTDRRSNQLSDQWQRFAVHFDDLPINRLSQVRIGLDLMGSGVVEVDQFEVFDRWFDERDAKAINQRLASSGPLLANPTTYESCRMLLDSYWLRFLDEHFRESAVTKMANGNAPGAGEKNSLKPLSASKVDSAAASLPQPASESEIKDDLNDRGLFRRLRRGNRIQR